MGPFCLLLQGQVHGCPSKTFGQESLRSALSRMQVRTLPAATVALLCLLIGSAAGRLCVAALLGELAILNHISLLSFTAP